MNAYLIAATVLLLGLVPCGIVALRGRAIDGVVALQAGQTVTTLATPNPAARRKRTSDDRAVRSAGRARLRGPA